MIVNKKKRNLKSLFKETTTKQMKIWEGVNYERERETNHKKLLMIKSKMRVGGGRWVGDGMVV